MKKFEKRLILWIFCGRIKENSGGKNMAINVKSEIGRLQTVLLHRPGSELEQLAPNSMARLLFDDIPYLRGAQAEHDCFADVLRERGVKVLYLSELMAQTISRSTFQ